MRINKYLALCGIASRRKCEELIKAGRVKINGKVITDLATDLCDDVSYTVLLDDQPVTTAEKLVYLKFHKPKACVCTASDEHGRKTVFDYIDKKGVRLFSVGRLDYETEGLLLLTNDGDLAHKLMHPSHEIEKVYVAVVKGDVTKDILQKLRAGVVLDDGYKTLPARVRVLYAGNPQDTLSASSSKKTETGQVPAPQTRLELSIKEGKNRQVRRMLEAVGLDVVFLKRQSMGMITIAGLPRGKYKELSDKEVSFLKRL